MTCATHVQVMNKNISYSGSVRQGLFHIIFIYEIPLKTNIYNITKSSCLIFNVILHIFKEMERKHTIVSIRKC